MYLRIRTLRHNGKRITQNSKDRVRQIDGYLLWGVETIKGEPVMTARVYFDGAMKGPPMGRLFEPTVHKITADSIMIHGLERVQTDEGEITVLQVWECHTTMLPPPIRVRPIAEEEAEDSRTVLLPIE